MKRFCLFLFCLAVMFLHTYLSAQELSNKSTISLLIAYPDPAQIVSSYGHTLLRVQDPQLNLDYVINYGTFDHSLTGFQTVIGIVRSKLNYEIWVMPFAGYYQETKKENRTLLECSFNFSPEEKKAIWQYLIATVRDKDHKYTFDFFSQNCTTFARDLITYNLGNRIVLPEDLGRKTYRDINMKYVDNKLWYVLLMDLLSGNNLDNRVAPYESLYEPQELKNAWSRSLVINPDGTKKALFASTKVLIKANEPKKTKTRFVLSPVFFSLVLLLIILCVSLFEWINKASYKLVDMVLFGSVGLLGLVFYVFKFACGKWYVLMDWDMLWLHPFHLLVVLLAIKSLGKLLVLYHYINVALLGLFAITIFFTAHPYNVSIALFTAGLFIRTVSFLYRVKQTDVSKPNQVQVSFKRRMIRKPV